MDYIRIFCPPSQECLETKSESRYAIIAYLSLSTEVIGIGRVEVEERVLVIELAWRYFAIQVVLYSPGIFYTVLMIWNRILLYSNNAPLLLRTKIFDNGYSINTFGHAGSV